MMQIVDCRVNISNKLFQQLEQFLKQFSDELLPKTRSLYYEATPKGVEKIWNETSESEDAFVQIAAELNGHLDDSNSVDEYKDLINKSLILSEYIATPAMNCKTSIPPMITAYCLAVGKNLILLLNLMLQLIELFTTSLNVFWKTIR